MRVGLVGIPPMITAGLTTILRPFQAQVTITTPDLLTVAPERVGPVDVLLCRLHDPAAAERLRELRSHVPVPVLMLSEAADDTAHRAAARHDVGLLPVDLDAASLARLLSDTGRCGTSWTTLTPLDGDWQSAQLSPRETQVLDLVCAGLTNAEIAEELFVSINSVKTYIRMLYRKIGVSRRSQCVVWGLESRSRRSWTGAPPAPRDALVR